MPISLSVSNVWKSYAAGVRGCSARVWALRGCSFELAPGERVALIGTPGSGRSTLLQCLAGHRSMDAGRIESPFAHHQYFACPGDLGEWLPRQGTLLLIDGGGEGMLAVHHRLTAAEFTTGRTGRGALLVAGSDVAGMAPFVDRIMMLRDGRLTVIEHRPVRRVAERVVAF